MGEYVCLRHAQLKIEHVQELAFDPPNIPPVEEPRAHRPVHVLQSRVVQILKASSVN